jgi:glucosamine-phosphate N-acetyltransferase
VVGAASLVVEQKFIRDASLCGHIEDVVTDKQLRGKGMGKMLIDTLVVFGSTSQMLQGHFGLQR